MLMQSVIHELVERFEKDGIQLGGGTYIFMAKEECDRIGDNRWFNGNFLTPSSSLWEGEEQFLVWVVPNIPGGDFVALQEGGGSD